MRNVDTSPSDSSATIVFRPRRRCPECGLVNTDRARRCRRCRRSFEDIDPRVASEALVSRLRARRIAAVAIVVVAIASIAFTAYGLHARAASRALYGERVRVLFGDAKSIETGIRADATAVVTAFDDDEVRSILAEQMNAWDERARRCATIRRELSRLVPPNTEKTEQQMTLDTLVAELQQVASELNRCAKASDAGAARVAARRFGDARTSQSRR